MKPFAKLCQTAAGAVVGMLALGVCAQTPNLPPAVRIVHPVEGAVFGAPLDLPLVAEARDADGAVVSVEFFAGDQSLGMGVRRLNATNVFALVWSNAPAGRHILTAKATDDDGAVGISLPVSITVGPLPPPPPPQPVVTIRASDPYATEPCPGGSAVDPARFTIIRSGNTNVQLLVFYSIGGTAANGTDYVRITNAVVVPAGRVEAPIVIHPLGDNLVEGTESVVLRLEPMACIAIYPPPPECYLVGQPAEAVAFIRDCPEPPNRPPLVQIVKPFNGAVFQAPATIGIVADTVDADGYVWKVEFFEGTNSIGEQSKMFLIPPTNGTHIPYEMVWKDVPPGRYVLTARATDNQGAVGVSAPVQIAVVTNPPPPVTNLPPVLSVLAVDPVAIEGTNCWGWRNPTNRWTVGTTNCVEFAADLCAPVWWFTNCGPKNAVFLVRRAGDTNAELTVRYALSGTATNGVDYDELPGVVTLPAGARRAEILVVPKPDNLPEPIETVILRLLPAPVVPNTPPAYLVGAPSRAGAVIVENPPPRPLVRLLADKCFHLGAEAVDGAWYRIECSLDLRTWTPLCTAQAVQGMLHFVDPDAESAPNRFYRAVPESEPVE